ncbi:hypothetical protein QFC19_006769 [Naganishia cerealis]|uniref:Uncharacterized protein n=1 Tax=Naganishia cerealis TaxID=610337 RepID=A0ACC2VEY4_9TREE|nr:hypothetical protein QFC19_006769 [Naganishia cerealis]
MGSLFARPAPPPGRGVPPGISDWSELWDLLWSGEVVKAGKLWWQAKWNAAEMKAFQDHIVGHSNTDEQTLGRQGTDIFLGDKQNRHERIYQAALASKAVYTLSGPMSSTPDIVSTTAFTSLEQNYVIEKHDNPNYLFWKEYPKDWILCSPRTDDQGQERFYLFSVKGTVGADDWLDNLAAGNNPRIQRGLLKEGQQMLEQAGQTLRDLLNEKKRVVFTGHSAGGAVAAYVYKELYREAVQKKAHWNMDCVVFGCAATDDRQVTFPAPGIDASDDDIGMMMVDEENDDTEEHNNNPNIRIAFCNRWDPVPRVTVSYVDWFVDNWNLYHALSDPEAREAFEYTPLPTDALVPFGQLVTLSDAPEVPPTGNTNTLARWLTPEQFRTLVYLDPVQHSMGLYIQRVTRLLTQSGFRGTDPGVQQALG